MQQPPTIPQQAPNVYYSGEDNTPPPKEGWKSVLSTILIILAAPAIAFLLTTFVFQSYQVDGESMETTLQDQDRLIVLKTGKTWANVQNDDYIPKRGEIVVFEKNDNPINSQQETSESRQLIKRVIGLPGERVVVKDGSITVFNEQFPRGFNPDETGDYGDSVSPTTPQNVDITVPDGEIFVAGDNRTNSSDSRSFGTIPAKDIIGNLVLRIYPFSKFESF